MPQMMPLNWLLLMFFFITCFYLMNNMNYFLKFFKLKSKIMSHKNLKYTWKW